MHLVRWAIARLGLEPVKQPLSNPAISNLNTILFSDTSWPEGHQIRREVRFCERAGWAQSNWAWRSIGNVDHSGSIYPRPDKAESRCCLGVLRCKGCGKLVRPRTKTADMKAQLLRNCSNGGCGGVLEWVTCSARTLHFVIEESGVEYSVWTHEGSHSSHPHPPCGRQSAHTHRTPSQAGPNDVSHGVSVTRMPSPKHAELEVVLPAATSAAVVPTPNSLAEPEAALLAATAATPMTTAAAALVPLPNSTNNLTIGPKMSELADPLRAVMWSESK
jgi:hypothetical protein